MSWMRPNPCPVVALKVTSVPVIVIAVAAPFPLSANGSAHTRSEEPSNCGAAASAEGAAEDGPKGSTEYQATKCILSRRFLGRHHQSETQHRRDSHISKHSFTLHSWTRLLRTHSAQVNWQEPGSCAVQVLSLRLATTTNSKLSCRNLTYPAFCFERAFPVIRQSRTQQRERAS